LKHILLSLFIDKKASVREYLILFLGSFLARFLASFLSRATVVIVTAVTVIDAFLAGHYITKEIFDSAVRVLLAPAVFTRNESFGPFALFAGHVQHCFGMSFIAKVLTNNLISNKNVQESWLPSFIQNYKKDHHKRACSSVTKLNRAP
jgi:hypothetical protein